MNSNDQGGKNLADMKTLQSNFTTPEQSKRLLELGVPADSADMYIECYWCDGHNGMWRYKIGSHEIFRDRKQIGEGVGAIRPCWSVGRLMEIFAICFDPDFIHFDTYADGINFLQQMMDKFETYAENMDFSKLEE